MPLHWLVDATLIEIWPPRVKDRDGNGFKVFCCKLAIFSGSAI